MLVVPGVTAPGQAPAAGSATGTRPPGAAPRS